MKKLNSCIIILISIIVFNTQKATVQALSDDFCPKGDGIVTYTPIVKTPLTIEQLKEDSNWGFGIYDASKTSPVNPIIVTQDENHTGVNITVEIVSYPGTITYNVHSKPCIGYDLPQKGMEACPPYHRDGLFYYFTDTCTPHTETNIYRHIDGASLMVWLKPTPKTEQWLGWTTKGLGDDRFPLRYMFPEKWSLGAWTPEGYDTVGDPGLWTEDEIKKFLAEHPGFNFLKADPREFELPSQYLPLAKNPAPNSDGANAGGSGRVVPLFGSFPELDFHGDVGGPAVCVIEGKGPGGPGDQGHCAVTVNGLEDLISGGANIFADDITKLTVSFSHIPMDLPGEWQIGVKVSITHAKYAGNMDETILDPKYLHRDPGNGYTISDPEHDFLTYMWIATMCNPAEEHGCEN
jgi:hypothetical protein